MSDHTIFLATSREKLCQGSALLGQGTALPVKAVTLLSQGTQNTMQAIYYQTSTLNNPPTRSKSVKPLFWAGQGLTKWVQALPSVSDNVGSRGASARALLAHPLSAIANDFPPLLYTLWVQALPAGQGCNVTESRQAKNVEAIHNQLSTQNHQSNELIPVKPSSKATNDTDFTDKQSPNGNDSVESVPFVALHVFSKS